MNIPNILTLIRLILVPVFGFLLFKENYIPAAAVFVAASFTDMLDGFIARKYNMITDFGKFFDPLADKLLSLTALFMLAYLGRIPWVIPGLVVGKELLIGLGGLVLYKKDNIVKGSNFFGKAATVMFFIAIVLLMFDFTLNAGQACIWVAIGVSILALLSYLKLYLDIRRTGKKE